MDSPIWLALIALLGIPGVTSAVTGIVKRLAAATGIGSRVWVYVASLAITGLVVQAVPVVTGDPAAVIAAWLTWATVNAELARRFYEALWERVGDEEFYLTYDN